MEHEHTLIDQALEGNRSALNELISISWNPLYRFISYKIKSQEDAKELTQETFLKAFSALSTYKKTGVPFSAYLTRIAHNLVIDFWRKKGRSPLMVDLTNDHHPMAENDRPEALAVNKEIRVELAKVLKELPDDQRQTIEYRIIAGLPIKDTALAMGKTEAAIKMLQQRALKNMRSLLITHGIVENQVRG